MYNIRDPSFEALVVGAMHAATPAAAHCRESEHNWIVLFLLTPLLVLLSPALLLVITLLAILKPDNQRLQQQRLVCRSGEAVLEAAPQLCLQLLIVFRTGAADDTSVSQLVFTITEKAPTRAFSWLKAPTSAFIFKTLLRH